jgi:hypothetical protein
MISKSKLGAIAFIAAIGLAPVASPAFAQYGAQYNPSLNGGGSAGYNHGLRYYRLKKHHHGKLHAQIKPRAAKPSGAGAPAPAAGAPAAAAGQAGGGAAKQPMGRP